MASNGSDIDSVHTGLASSCVPVYAVGAILSAGTFGLFGVLVVGASLVAVLHGLSWARNNFK